MKTVKSVGQGYGLVGSQVYLQLGDSNSARQQHALLTRALVMSDTEK